MDALERRYRALVRLLPADHRAARGEELLGVLLDLDDGRAWPSPRQAAGVVGLAVWLRLGQGLALLLCGLLVAASTGIAVMWIGGPRRWAVGDPGGPAWPTVVAAAVPVALALAAAAAWSPGRRRLTAWLLAAEPPAALAAMMFDARTVPLVTLPAVLAVAAWLLPVARPRRALAASVLAAAALWAVVAGVGRPDAPWPIDARVSLFLAVAGAAAGVVAAGLMVRGAGRLVRAAAWLSGTLAGLLVPNLAWYMLSGRLLWLLPAAVIAAVAAAAAGHSAIGYSARRLIRL
ncbi:hypothetical protein [Dactylosporangium darangshiense]|uniref:Integral membrane protein n=1 Tax=Dactylosporangium darangshiense TaxID=579108 RepID=A0ABP8D7F6_9ACTN